MEKKLDLLCPRCHGTMELNEDKTELFCPYCRHKIIIKKGETLEQLIERVKQISYAKTQGTKLAEEEAERRKNIKSIKIFILTILCVLIIGIGGILVKYFAREYIKDPFDYVSVSFSGTNGTGEAQLNIKHNNIKTNDIKFILSKGKNLSNEEYITVTASSEKYRFGKKQMSIKVEGLNNYLNSLDELNNEMKKFIHKKSYEFQEEKVSSSLNEPYSNNPKLVSLESLKMYLITNLKDKNTLYDVYSAKIKAKSGNIYTKYVVTSYSDVVIVNNGEDLLRFKNIKAEGRVIDAGKTGVNTVLSSDYAGNLIGFSTLSDAETYVKNYPDTTMKIFEEQ